MATITNVAPSRARGLKQVLRLKQDQGLQVAPSRARGLKQLVPRYLRRRVNRRALTGAWIETVPHREHTRDRRRALTGAWIETEPEQRDNELYFGRALTGAWIETLMRIFNSIKNGVAPSRARGLKLNCRSGFKIKSSVAPSRARGLKHCSKYVEHHSETSRALTGAWIETTAAPGGSDVVVVAPSRARGLKPQLIIRCHHQAVSRPHGRVD